ncbi:MAG: lectin-like domain-containing protein [Flavobacteriia bacterium]|jgi:hypothetical protein
MKSIVLQPLTSFLGNKILLSILLVLAFNSKALATKYRYLTSPYSVSGAVTVCPSASTTPISVTFTVAGTCGSGSAADSDFTISWYSNNSNSTSGGTLVSGPTAGNTATLSYSYNAPISASGTKYYYCVITYSTPGNVTGCNGGLSSITSSNAVQVVVSASPTTAAAGADQTLASCTYNTTLAGNTPASGTGAWSCVSGCAGISITSSTSATSTVTSLPASSTTVLRWTTTLGSCTSTDDVSITTGSCLNETCADAIAVSCGGTYAGTTVGASNAGETSLPACGTSPGAPGVWYVFTGDGSIVTASLCSGTSYDSKINVYSGVSCGTISTCVASNDDGCGSASTVTFSTSAGTNYYILVNGYSSATGAFSLAITCCTPDVPSCATQNSPANAATGVSQCSSLTWTAPATSGCSSVDSYDVYFGTSNPPAFLANTTSTSYPITTSPSTVYYWQIRPKNSSGSAAGCSIRSFTSAAGGNPQYTMVDDATSSSPFSCVQLTSPTNDQRGCAWDLNSTLNFGANFSFDFTVNLGNSDGGGDGLAFTMHNDPQGRCVCGTNGGALGSGGILNSVVVEIDTYVNTEDRDDGLTGVLCSGGSEPDHLDIWLNGVINPTGGGCPTPAGARVVATAVPLTDAGANYNVENGSNHILRISWAAGSSTLTARLMNTALTTTYATISSTFNPMTVFGTNTPYFGFTASTGGVNNTQSFCNPPLLLPVELMSFNAYCFKNYRKIYWTTASENNNAYFTVEKSYDGVHFSTLEIVPSNSLKNGITSYEISDEDLTIKTVYYRLSQTDLNGVTKTFDMISSNCNTKINSLTIENVFDNSEEIILDINCINEIEHHIKLIDNTGRIVMEKILNPSKGMNNVQLSKEKLSTGLYILQIENDSQKVSKRFLIQ